MNGFSGILEQVAGLTESHASAAKRDYMGPDGLLVCGQCHTPKQCRVTLGGRERVVGCLCRCAAQRRNARQEALKESQRQMYQLRMRRSAIESSMLRDARFEIAKPSALIDKAKNYVSNWDIVRENNVGLLFMGSVGMGKSYAAACICNAMLDQGVSCHMTNFGRILSMEWEERAQFLRTLGHYELLVLDDLGAERDTEFSNEIIFSVIDERYRAKKPIIVTTNLSLPEMKKPDNMAKGRIYDRLLEICGPVLCEGENFRQDGGKAVRKVLAEVLK